MAYENMIDLSQDIPALKMLYAPLQHHFRVLDVPTLPFAILDGKGAPEPVAVGAAIKTLELAIEPIRREARQRMGRDFMEAPVEVLYWAADPKDVEAGRRENWQWRVQVTLPVWTDKAGLEGAVAQMRAQLGNAPAPRWEAVTEGKCVQVMHVGSPADLSALLSQLYTKFLPQEGLEPLGVYHEIYLSDWSKASSSRHKMIVRQPIR